MFYNAKVQVLTEDEKGNVKKVTESYLVNAITVTEAEAVVVKAFEGYPGEFAVKSVTETKIVEILGMENNG